MINPINLLRFVEMEGGRPDSYYEELAQKALKRLQELEESKEWKDNGDKPCKMFKTEIGNRVASKGIDKVDYNIEKVIEFLDQEDSLKIINPMLLDIKVLKVVEGKYRVNYMLYKGIWPVDNRDFVNCSGKLRASDSKMYIATIGCEFDYPAQKGAVRGEVYVGGYIIEKLSENQSQITYISDADLKGSIPGMIKNTLSAKQGEIASKVGKGMASKGY